jgi:nitroimidazol reductase NimA-like FMN-containing flavoprotein (pyridoxamine 5'-phosphate oxidase superfamily)
MNGHPPHPGGPPHGGGAAPRKLFHKIALREMTGEEIDALMTAAVSGRLGTVGPDGPYVVPLAFGWRNGEVCFHCHRAGKKLENIGGDDRVCFQVDTHTPDTLTYQSVIVMGRAERLEGEEAVAAMGTLMKKYASELKMPKAAGLEKMIRVFRIRDAKTTGKRSEPSKA